MSYWRAFQHIVWGTKGREALIVEGVDDLVERSIRQTCKNLDIRFHGIGIMPDHIHLVCSIPPRHAPSEVIRQIKAYSSRLVNDARASAEGHVFYWQPEYGYLTFAEDALKSVVAYTENQLEHHRAGRLIPQYELIENPYPHR
jgi:REP element-mobilizing transposase RayT